VFASLCGLSSKRRLRKLDRKASPKSRCYSRNPLPLLNCAAEGHISMSNQEEMAAPTPRTEPAGSVPVSPGATEIANRSAVEGVLAGDSPSGPVDDIPSPGEVGEEIDMWWGSYAPRTMAPSFALCMLLTLVISIEAWSLGIWQERSPARYTAQALLALLWLILVARWAYRITAINYRLTNHRLFRDVGFYRLQSRQIPLSQIAQVVVERRPSERLLRIGRLRVLLQGSSQPPVILEGVCDPDHVAMAIRKQVQHVRQVTS
jgi:membrane protein YdbS with pleckstrin-like domain